ncbi:DUF4153 domain-containing protein [Tropicibacter naphthalenivorans]|uniref:DUF4153 domain-containing protein n=1 Tax=Tropicibacter naphthalenivorans TaxID=441103 RepID=A0A0N7M172_9RHOB|nr:DUF4153 domain-containing protein [Tropicibacter naphthalenivorans]CUH82457.1 hypothetical protein TRN7648_03997 [Tropicibacter naphthalenivorans]SMD06017.1 protein of unknown function [Tropicibacter naphthalenivorans]
MQSDEHTRLSLVLGLAGWVAGLACYVLIEAWQNAWLPDHLLVFASTACLAGMAMFLALTGPAPAGRVMPLAVGAGLVLGGAELWGALRFQNAEAYMAMVYPLLFGALAWLIATGFAAAHLTGQGGWRDYPALFSQSWRVVVNFVVSLVFVGLFWGLLGLSHLLLDIVGLDLMRLLTYFEVLPWVLSGTVLGLAMARVHASAEYISPYLVLRLLRMLSPIVLAVIAVFLVMLPVRGWDGLMQGFSPAATLMAFAAAGVTLVTVAVERSEFDEVKTPWMRSVTQALALTIPGLSALALWAVMLRVWQYSWTPQRLLAVTMACVLLVYGLSYLASVMIQRAWMARIRQANIWMALLVLAVSLAWFTPLFQPERISAQGQLSIAQNGGAADQIDLRELTKSWGNPGAQALSDIQAARPDLAEAIDLARQGRSKPAVDPATRAQRFVEVLPIYPSGRLDPADLSEIRPYLITKWLAACERTIAAGPGCALFVTQDGATGPRRAILFTRSGTNIVEAIHLERRAGKLGTAGATFSLDGPMRLDDRTLDALHRGEAKLVSREIQALDVGGRSIFAHN